MLGLYILERLNSLDAEVISVSRSNQHAHYQVNTESYLEVRDLIRAVKPTHIVNLIGLTSVEDCERSALLSDQVNALPLLNVVSARDELNQLNTRVLQISTDHVYDSHGPSEEHQVTIVNNYAASKLKAERCLDMGRDIAIRTNFVGPSKSPNRQSLTDWVLDSCKSNENVKVLQDVYFSPLSMSLVADLSLKALFSDHCGIVNLGSHGGMSKAEFDIRFARSMGLPVEGLQPIARKDADFLKAPRPEDMTMDSSLFEKLFQVSLPSTDELAGLVAREYRGIGVAL